MATRPSAVYSKPQLAAALDVGLIRDVVIDKNDRESEDF